MPTPSTAEAPSQRDMRRALARSAVTNGRLLPGIDLRNTWARRLRDLIGLHLSDLGGADAASEAEKAIIRRAATIEVELERLEAKFAREGEASAEDLDLYSRASNTLRRHLEAVGLQRRPRDVTPSLSSLLVTDSIATPQGGSDVARTP